MERNVYIITITETTAYGRVITERYIKKQERLPEIIMDYIVEPIEFHRRVEEVNRDKLKKYIVLIDGKETDSKNEQLMNECMKKWLNSNSIEVIAEKQFKNSHYDTQTVFRINKETVEVDETINSPKLNIKITENKRIIAEYNMVYGKTTGVERMIEMHPDGEVIINDTIAFYNRSISSFDVVIRQDSTIVKVETPKTETRYLFFQSDRDHTPLLNKGHIISYELYSK